MKLDKMYEKVIEAGEFSFWTDVVLNLNVLVYVVSVLVIILISRGLYVWYVEGSREFAESFSLSSLPIILMAVLVLFVHFEEKSIRKDHLEEWKTGYVAKLFDRLEVEKSEIMFMKVEDSLVDEYRPLKYMVDVNRGSLTDLTLSFNDGGRVVTLTDMFDVRVSLSDGDEPYLEYKHLEKDLGNGIDAGYYDAIVYVPEGYKFADIK